MVAFHSFDLHRQHYQSEWHRFNLNRRVKGLPPVTEPHYDSVVSAATVSDSADKRQERQLQEKMERVSVNQDPTSMVGVTSEEELEQVLKERLSKYRLDVTKDCLFCTRHQSGSVEENLEHMRQQHGLYVPDRDCVTDLPGLLQYLADKVAVGYCLYCADGRLPFAGLEAVRKHMLDKGHVKIRYDEEGSSELADFYNWDHLFEDADSDQDAALITPDGTELLTVGGSRIGNRAYFKYYKQYLRPAPATEEEAERRQRHLDSQAMIRQRGQNGQLALGSVRLSETERRDQRVSMVDRLQEELALGVKANKFQPHFRLQIR